MPFKIRNHVLTSKHATEEVPGSNFGRITNRAEDLSSHHAKSVFHRTELLPRSF
jgi:hypothetical protein